VRLITSSPTRACLQPAAAAVYEAYIKQNCDNEVNVCAATRSKVEKALAEWALKVRPYLRPI
jgi:hypothetical protein